MDVRESIEGARAEIDTPRLGLIEFERGRARRIPFALLFAILFHLLAGLTLVRLGQRADREEQTATAAAAARPTPVRIVFYETKPRPPEPPPPQTAVLSDRDSRARSEVAPLQPAPTRLPAARGESPDERKPSQRDAAERGLPREPPPGDAPATPAERADRPRPPDMADLTAAQTGVSPALRAGQLGEAAAASAGAGGRFAANALDSAIRHQGFGNPTSGVGETGSLEFDAKDFEWGPYARKIYEIVDRNWKTVIPLAARLPGVSGKVKLRFRIHKNGTVEALELVLSSGRAALDQAALASIELSNPLPPLPPEFSRDDVGVTFAYFYNLPIGAGE